MIKSLKNYEEVFYVISISASWHHGCVTPFNGRTEPSNDAVIKKSCKSFNTINPGSDNEQRILHRIGRV